MGDDLQYLPYIVNHVFLPPKLPQEDDLDGELEHALSALVHSTAEEYASILSTDHQAQWAPILRMLENIHLSHRSLLLSEEHMNHSMAGMQPGGVLSFLIRAQNAGIIVRKLSDKTVFEFFEVSPSNVVIMGAKGKVRCSYPGPAIAVPRQIVEDPHFREELNRFLVSMNIDALDSAPTTVKAGSEVVETRDTAHPRYITQLLTEILQGMGDAVDVTRIQKRIADDVLWESAVKPWRRSPLWLLIRVALQTSLYREGDGHSLYKTFMVYLMARILRMASENGFGSDLVYCMRAKTSHRLYKLGSVAPDFVLRNVREAGNVAQKLLEERWLKVQKDQATSPYWAPEKLNIAADTHLSLLKSRVYLNRVLNGIFSRDSSNTFHPNHFPRFRGTHAFDTSENNGLSEAFAKNSYVALADFELAVQDHLDDWVSNNLLHSSGCTTIAACIDQYYTAALTAYGSNPEYMSIMLLTVFDLWVGLDKLAVAQCPLLAEYSPEVPVELLDPLLLRRSNSFRRVDYIQEYLRERHAVSGRSVFTDEMSEGSFAVQYFDASAHHRSLRSRIEKEAAFQRRQKVDELLALNARHRDLQDKSRSLDHKYDVNNRGISYHAPWCSKCSLADQASRLTITVHEWPLPRHPLEAKTAVFELSLPPVFGIWRMTTYKILRDISATTKRSSVNPSKVLGDYHGLQSYLKGQIWRITLASSTESFSNSHYRTTRIPSDEASVCVNSGLCWRLFDGSKKEWAAERFASCSLAQYCTLQLPVGFYRGLQYAVGGTSHTSNQIMAGQSDCPSELTLHEYIAFASLRSGPRIQWFNILRELTGRSLSLYREAVHTLIMQAAWQIGPQASSSDHREWHAELGRKEFGDMLLTVLQELFLSIQGNWVEVVSMRTITILISRLLASTNDLDVVNRAYTLMRRVRTVTLAWMHQLARQLQDSKDELQVREFQWRVCETAATCRGTYDVDPDHVPYLLNSVEDTSTLIECAIQVHDNSSPSLTEESRRWLLYRGGRLSLLLEPVLSQQISYCRDGLDGAIMTIWPSYRPGSEWKHMDSPDDRWVITQTAAGADQVSQTVQVNLLTGQLLVNGKPFGRLPEAIVKHPLYVRVFEQRILDVIPADMPGLDFVARDLIHGYQVFFALRMDDPRLVIRARRGMDVLELIPHDIFVDDLPALLVDNHTHWLTISTGEIELRPLENSWQSSDQNWRIYFSANGTSTMRKGRSLFLVDVRSPTTQMMSARVEPLEYSKYLIVTYSPDDDKLLVDLPRFRLSFLLNHEWHLESQNMPGMVIDMDQSSGTMFGLSSQLVICSKDQPLQSRRVIIPHGEIAFGPEKHHVRVTIKTVDQSNVRYHEYTIDTILGCLVSNVSLISRLYKIYLHAVSSYCLLDPLTKSTGTEEALRELRSASCLSIQKLGTDERKLLGQIHSLTPRRVFYPSHLQVMQTVTWSSLAPTVQHYDFCTLSQAIMDYADRMQIFDDQSDPEADCFESLPSLSESAHLLKRAAHRNTVFYPEEFAGPLPSSTDDVVHLSRDVFVYRTTADGAVVDVSARVCEWPLKLDTNPRLFDKMKQWRCLSGPKAGLALSYSREWLQPNLGQRWISLYDKCRGYSRDNNRFRLVFILSALAYSLPESRCLISTILAFATVDQFYALRPPLWPSYDLDKGFQPNTEKLSEIIHRTATSFEESPEVRLPANPRESEAALGERRFSSFITRRDTQVKELLVLLTDQWPCQEPCSPPDPSDGSCWLFDINRLMPVVKAAFRNWYRNKLLREHVAQVQAILDQVRSDLVPTKPLAYEFAPCSSPGSSTISSITFSQLFDRNKPCNLGVPPILREDRIPPTSTTLRSLLSEFRNNTSSFHQLYGNHLEESLQSLGDDFKPEDLSKVDDYRVRCQDHLDETFIALNRALSPSNLAEETIFTAGQWPRVTTKSLLGRLSFHSRIDLTDAWREALMSFAQALLRVQHARRLTKLARTQNSEEFSKEFESTMLDVQAETIYPDWLLIQVEGDFLVRPIQIRVAQEMIAPSSNQNTALQLNMGEGKSSVIVPMVAAALSDGQKFMRVVVLKSLATQMFQLLVGRLSGLANRRIFYMPFSRSATLTAVQVGHIHELCMECMRVGGILIVQPEHILSFKLMGLDQLFSASSAADHNVVEALLKSQRWIESNSRDILDESDEILHARYQLVYTVGQQRSLEGHPDRWTAIQHIFSLVRKHVYEIQRRFPHGIELQDASDGSFPYIRVLRADAGRRLVSLIAGDALRGAVATCPFHLSSDHIRRCAHLFITEMIISTENMHVLEKHFKVTGSWKSLLLLRGLLVYGILLYVLQERRWRVDYGLDYSRSLLAVPYRAKDVPSLRAEFGHPDIAIALTCLSYYFQGLTPAQLDRCFDLLDGHADPTSEYEKWIHDNHLVPQSLREYRGVNTSDPQQRKEYLFPLFHRNHAVVDFYLSQIVFPKAAKEFPEKLATSGWDLAETKRHITTGFSGTNDGRYLLPTSIIQDDPVNQLSTNAKVLTYILQPENDHYQRIHQNDELPSAESFLQLMARQSPKIGILLDVGAQMLGLNNADLAKRWLAFRPDASAVIFFEVDELAVLSRDGNVETFISSPFNRQIDKCLVYLDDSHTRGTDLKLPRDFRGAVTLGPKVTKDRLLQGCMRMRKLGHGQSVMFFAPLEVDRAIREAARKGSDDQIQVVDILRWAMLETCADIHRHAPHWVQQGLDYQRRRNAWKEYCSSTHPSVEKLQSSWLQPEARALDDMYGLPPEIDSNTPHAAFEFPEILERCKELGITSFSDARMEEEQEREVHHEVERERQVERPPRAIAATHQVHDDVLKFVKTGLIRPRSSQFVPVFFQFNDTASACQGQKWSPNLLSSRDFSTTIEGSIGGSKDYLRPVNWIVSSIRPRGAIFVVLSPYEVNDLLPEIRQSTKVHLHQYTPRTTPAMRSFDDLTFYSIPSLPLEWAPPPTELRNQLNLWAGQLYLPNYERYIQLCNFLGIYTEEHLSMKDISIQNDGFIKPEYPTDALLLSCPFTESPIEFLKEVIGLRRKGMSYSSTHMGKILQARLLTEDDFSGSAA